MHARARLALAATLASALVAGCGHPGAAPSAGSFTAFVDDYLDGFARRHPSIAAGNGLHAHDDQLEDFSAAAMAREIEWLHGERRSLDAIEAARLTPDERVDHRILQGIIDGWLLDLDRVQTWTRNPMIYASAITDGVHNLMTMESSPAESRMRQAAAKLQQVPRLLAAGRENLRRPPKVFVERAIVMFRGASALLGHDLPVAFSAVGDASQQASLKAAADAARRAIDDYATELESRVLPQADGSYALGTAAVEARYRAEELIDTPAAELLKIGERELKKGQDDFTATAARVNAGKPPRDAVDVWRDVLTDHPKRGELVAAAQKTVDELFAFIRTKRLVDLPEGERVIVAAAPVFDLGLASMHSSPPLEPHPVKSYYFITDAQADWPADRQDAWLQKFNYATLADISAHEVAPGHFVHSLFMRRTPGKIRRIWIGLNPFPQPSSGQDGWAHYAEQMMVDQGFGNGDPKMRLAQLEEALLRDCRYVTGIKLHTEGWTVEQGQKLFVEQCFQEPANAYEEARRGAYNPTYLYYTFGKLEIQKMASEYMLRKGASLKQFHDVFVSQGGLALPLVRRILFR